MRTMAHLPLLFSAPEPTMRVTQWFHHPERRWSYVWAHTDGSRPFPTPHLSLLDKDIMLATSVQGIGSARRRGGGMQAVHSLLHFPSMPDQSVWPNIDAGHRYRLIHNRRPIRPSRLFWNFAYCGRSYEEPSLCAAGCGRWTTGGLSPFTL